MSGPRLRSDRVASNVTHDRNDFGQLIAGKMLLPSGWLGGWNLGTPLGVMVGGVAGGWFQDRSGRRLSLAVGSSIAAVGIAIMFCCFVSDSVDSRRGLFLGGKLVQGLGIGMLMSTTQTYSKLPFIPHTRYGDHAYIVVQQCQKSFFQSSGVQSCPF